MSSHPHVAPCGAHRDAYTANNDAPFATRHGLSRVPVAVGIAVVLLIAVLAIPTKQRCGAPGLSCATTVDARGAVHYYYEVEPLGVYFVEIMTDTNIPLCYTSGEDVVKMR
jgi:hypothetical protein